MTITAPDILYVLAHGFAARMILQSELMTELHARGITVAAVAPNADAGHFVSLCERNHVQAVTAPHTASKLLGQYGAARRYLFEDYEKNASLNSKHLYETRHAAIHPVIKARARFGKVVNDVFRRAPALPRLTSRAEHRLLGSRPLREMLRELRPRMVVSTYPVAWLEALTILEAQRLAIPTVGQLLSWDNITCKGRFAAVPDRFISWGPIMTQELEEFYSASGDRVVEAGVAHFDLHTRPMDQLQWSSHLTSLGLDPTRPYLFVGMSASFFAPKEVDIVEWLAARVCDGTFGPAVQLLVRPHPQNIRGSMADPAIVQRITSLSGGPVAVDLPNVVSDQMDFADGDMARLSALLHGAAVTINSGSTLTIDALIHDRPVILTSFDADAELPWWESARRLVEFPHLKKLLSYGGVYSASSFADLSAAIKRYLHEPGQDREARQRALHAECGVSDGGACVRIADGLERMLADCSAADA